MGGSRAESQGEHTFQFGNRAREPNSAGRLGTLKNGRIVLRLSTKISATQRAQQLQLNAVIGDLTWVTPIALGVTLPALLPPGGHLRSRRWRLVVAASVTGIVLILAGGSVAPGRLHSLPIDNPLGLDGVAGGVAWGLLYTGVALHWASLVAALVCVVLTVLLGGAYAGLVLPPSSTSKAGCWPTPSFPLTPMATRTPGWRGRRVWQSGTPPQLDLLLGKPDGTFLRAAEVPRHGVGRHR